MVPILIEVVMPLITTIEFKCNRCGPLVNDLDARKNYLSSCEEEYPEDWKLDNARLDDCLQKISEIYRHRVRIKIIDAQSPLGIWKRVRHRFSGTPAFIVDRANFCVGWNLDRLEELIDARIEAESDRISARMRPD